MSSTAAPEDSPTDAPPETGTGGSSKGLTQGEIVFVTLITFVVLVAIILGSYAIWRRRQKGNLDQKGVPDGGKAGNVVVDLEAAGMANEGAVGADQNGKYPMQPQDARFNSQQRTSSRRGSMNSSSSSDRNMPRRGSQNRRATVESGGPGTRRSSDGGGSTAGRRASLSSMGSNVSSNYKLAAIEHMNQISQTGRHD